VADLKRSAEEKMEKFLIGSWKSESSNIPDYEPGREWLHFTQEGIHVMELLHPGQNIKSVKNEFTVQHEKEAFRFCPTKKRPDGSAQVGWPVSIVRISQAAIAVTPDLPKHGFTTIYRRVSPETEPNQAVQRTPAAPSSLT